MEMELNDIDDVFTSTTYIWKDNDDEHLISNVQENPTLWDTKRSDYRDAVKKQRLYMKISRQFRGSTPAEVEKRFTFLKEKYRREKKKEDAHERSGSGASNHKQWHLMTKMEFLGRNMKPRKTISFDPRPTSISADESVYLDLSNEILPQSPSPPSTDAITIPAESKCPISSSKTSNRMREEFFKESANAIKRIGDSAATIAAQPNVVEKDPNKSHFKVFGFI